jgi:thiol-disulfide isomerase/thioredoxin
MGAIPFKIKKAGKWLFLCLLMMGSASLIQHCSAQKPRFFHLTIQKSPSINEKDVTVYINTGNSERHITVSGDSVVLNDSFSSKYVLVNLIIKKSNREESDVYGFYINELPALISLEKLEIADEELLFDYSSSNAFSTRELEEELLLWTTEAQNVVDSLISIPGPLDENFFHARRKLIDRQLEFITLHKEEYFSFRLFNQLSMTKFPGPINFLLDDLLPFYENTFSAVVRASKEGRIIEERLKANRFSLKEGMLVPEFASHDYRGSAITSASQGKYRIYSFWASWCIPCLKEIPALLRIRDEFPDSKLEIVSINFDEDSTKFITMLLKFRMDWVHIYFDKTIPRKFGVNGSGLPQLFLFDNEGRLLYNQSSGKETNTETLEVLISILRKKLGNDFP